MANGANPLGWSLRDFVLSGATAVFIPLQHAALNDRFSNASPAEILQRQRTVPGWVDEDSYDASGLSLTHAMSGPVLDACFKLTTCLPMVVRNSLDAAIFNQGSQRH